MTRFEADQLKKMLRVLRRNLGNRKRSKKVPLASLLLSVLLLCITASNTSSLTCNKGYVSMYFDLKFNIFTVTFKIILYMILTDMIYIIHLLKSNYAFFFSDKSE